MLMKLNDFKVRGSSYDNSKEEGWKSNKGECWGSGLDGTLLNVDHVSLVSNLIVVFNVDSGGAVSRGGGTWLGWGCWAGQVCWMGEGSSTDTCGVCPHWLSPQGFVGSCSWDWCPHNFPGTGWEEFTTIGSDDGLVSKSNVKDGVVVSWSFDVWEGGWPVGFPSSIGLQGWWPGSAWVCECSIRRDLCSFGACSDD